MPTRSKRRWVRSWHSSLRLPGAGSRHHPRRHLRFDRGLSPAVGASASVVAGGEPDARSAEAVGCRAEEARPRVRSRPDDGGIDRWKGASNRAEPTGATLDAELKPCGPMAEESSLGPSEWPCCGGNPGAEVRRVDPTMRIPSEVRTPNGSLGGNSRWLVHPEWVAGGQLPIARSPTRVRKPVTDTLQRSWSVASTTGSERATPKNRSRIDGSTSVGPQIALLARWRVEIMPDGFGRRALCDGRDEGGEKRLGFRGAPSGTVSRDERAVRADRLAGERGWRSEVETRGHSRWSTSFRSFCPRVEGSLWCHRSACRVMAAYPTDRMRSCGCETLETGSMGRVPSASQACLGWTKCAVRGIGRRPSVAPTRFPQGTGNGNFGIASTL